MLAIVILERLVAMLATLRSELAVAMILTGCANVRDAGRDLLPTLIAD